MSRMNGNVAVDIGIRWTRETIEQRDYTFQCELKKTVVLRDGSTGLTIINVVMHREITVATAIEILIKKSN